MKGFKDLSKQEIENLSTDEFIKILKTSLLAGPMQIYQFPNKSTPAGNDLFLLSNTSAGNLTNNISLTQFLTNYINPLVQISEAQVTNLIADLNLKANISGANFTGPVVLASDPTVPLGAATKQYVDGLVSPGEYLKVVNNLSDVANGYTSAVNLGLGNLSLYISSSTILTSPLPRRIGFNISSSGQTLQLPDATTLKTNTIGDIFFLDNYSNYDVQILDGTSSPVYLIKAGTKVFYTPDSNASIAGIWYFWPWIGSINNSSSYINIIDLNSAYAQTTGQNLTISNGLNLLSGTLSIGSSSYSSNALLNLSSTTQGMQPVTMTTAQMNAIPVTPQDAGLTVYVTDMTNGYYYFDGANWVYISNGGGSGNSLQAAYNNGNTIAINTGFPFYVSNQSGLSNFIWLYSPGVPSPYNYSSLEGMRFTPNVNVTVTALQYVNQYFSSGSRQVAIFRVSDQSLIVSDLVYKTDPLDPTGNYRTHIINSVTLYAGVPYVVVCIVPANENWTFYSLSNHPDFNYTGITYGQNASTIVYPTTIQNVPTSVYGNQNFQYSKVVSSVSINDGTQHSILNAYSTTQGFLPPVLTTSQESTLTASLGSLDEGLQWVNSTNNVISYWDGIDKQQVLTVDNCIQGTNMSLDTSTYPGKIIFNSTGGGSTSTQVQGSFNSTSPLTSTPVTSADTPIAVSSSFNVVNAVGTNVSLATISGVQTLIIQNTSSGGRWCSIDYDLTLYIPTNSGQTYGFTVYTNTGAVAFFQQFTVIGTAPLYKKIAICAPMVFLNTNDYVYLTVNSSLNTGPAFNAYYFNGRLLDTTIASIPNTNSLSQGTNNLYLSQNGGTTYEYLSGTATVGNLAAFNSTGGQFIDSGVPATFVPQFVQVSGTTQQMAMNTTYIITGTSTVTFTLPATNAGIGETKVCGYGNANWIVQTNAGQTIIDNGLSSPTSASSSTIYDNATFIYAGNNSGIFQVEYQNGMQINLN